MNATPSAPRRGQALLLNFFGAHVLGRDRPEGVATAIVIEVLGRFGIAEQAARSTLNRMVGRDMLSRERRGRTAHFFLTERAEAVLLDGQRRIAAGPLRDPADADGHGWVLLAFTMPTQAQKERHLLRSRLSWAGFGLLQNGLWIAPKPVDVDSVLTEEMLGERIHVFDADPSPGTDLKQLAPEIWDLDTLAAAYDDFSRRWSESPAVGEDPLVRHLDISVDWLGLLRRDPRLPESCLPDGWPARQAQEVYARALDLVRSEARAEVDQLFDTAS